MSAGGESLLQCGCSKKSLQKSKWRVWAHSGCCKPLCCPQDLCQLFLQKGKNGPPLPCKECFQQLVCPFCLWVSKQLFWEWWLNVYAKTAESELAHFFCFVPSMVTIGLIFTRSPHLHTQMQSELSMAQELHVSWFLFQCLMMTHRVPHSRCRVTSPVPTIPQNEQSWFFSSMVMQLTLGNLVPISPSTLFICVTVRICSWHDKHRNQTKGVGNNNGEQLNVDIPSFASFVGWFPYMSVRSCMMLHNFDKELSRFVHWVHWDSPSHIML